MLIAAVLVLLSLRMMADGQDAPKATREPQQPRFEDKVDVVGITPIHGLGLPKNKVPANVQVFTADRIASSLTLDAPTLLIERAASVGVNDAQGGAFQPDLLFRGFTGSPLLGASEGLAVYQDGVRVNEAFGDTVNWDVLPDGAIASINLMPGSNPLFGMNALGGALSIQTKDGFAFPVRRATARTGSFSRHLLETEIGGHARSLAYFIAASLTDEAGWRNQSPSTIRRSFADLGWRGAASSVNLSVTAASNDVTGNGAAPIQLLEQSRAAVFTHPDRTDHDVALATLKGRSHVSSQTRVEGVAYYRQSRIATLNGDTVDDADAEPYNGINNRSHTRGSSRGVTAQVTRTAPLWGRENHFVAGAGVDAASTRFAFATEWAYLTPERGTIGTGIIDEASLVDLHSRSTIASAFVTNTWSVNAAVSLTGSARVNWSDVALRDRIGTALSGDHRFRRVNPAAGITWQVRTGLNLYSSYAQSSRVPTPVELTCADPEDPCRLPNAFVSDPPLNQIVASTWEVGARGVAGRASWSTSAFSTAVKEDVIFVSSGALRGEGHFENVDRTERRGLEMQVEYEAPARLSAFAAYTFQRATFGSDLMVASPFHPLADGSRIHVAGGSRLPGVPRQSVKFGVDAVVTRGLNVGVTARAQSGHHLRGDEANLLEPVPGFVVINAQARQRLTGRMTAVAQVQNVLDARYYTFGVLGDAGLLGEDFESEPRFYSPGSRRGAWVGLAVRF